MELLGPDGKEMQTPQARRMPSRQEKFNMAWMMFTLMTTEERRQFVKSLRPLRRKLDVMYPLGMTEEAIKNDLTKAALQVVPNEQGNAVPTDPQGSPEPSVPAQPQSDQSGEETAPLGEEPGC